MHCQVRDHSYRTHLSDAIFENGAAFLTFEYDAPDRLARIRCANGVNSRIFHDGLLGVPNSPPDLGHGQGGQEPAEIRVAQRGADGA